MCKQTTINFNIFQNHQKKYLTFLWYGPRTTHPQKAYAKYMIEAQSRNLNTFGIAHLRVMTGICKTKHV